jgi:DNA repair protein RAD5
MRNTNTQHHTMESPHPDERPVKKRRFFIEDSSPTQAQSKPIDPPPSSPPPHSAETPDESNGNEEESDFGSFDVGMLQAVVGELSITALQKLRDVSGSDVQRGMQVEKRSKPYG